jgi:hypothetical protein
VTRYFDRDADYYPVRKFPEARPCHGIAEIARFHVEYRQAWDRFTFSLKEVIPLDDHRVFARASLAGEGRESGVLLEGDVYQCYWLRHGRFFRVEDHLTLAGALRALDLGEAELESARMAAA